MAPPESGVTGDTSPSFQNSQERARPEPGLSKGTWALFTLVQSLAPKRASQVVLVAKNPLANAEDVRDAGQIPGWGRSPGGGHNNPLQYSCLENPMDRGAWGLSLWGRVA